MAVTLAEACDIISVRGIERFINSRIPRLTMTVGYDGRFSGGDYGIWVECPPDREAKVTQVLQENGAVEVRSER